ncbi:MAG: glycosyltransferase family 4 protein [Phycisphaerales bacterium]
MPVGHHPSLPLPSIDDFTPSRMVPVSREWPARADGRPRELWIVEEIFVHYRIPVWDRIAQRLGDGWRLRVFADPEQSEKSIRTARTYFEPQRTPFSLGGRVYRWPGLLARIRAERPAAVFASATPRCLTVWRLPGACRAAGAALVAWTKGHRELDTPGGATDRVRIGVLRRFDAIVCYGQSARKDLLRHGLPEDRLFVAQNSIDTARIFEQRAALLAEGERLRRVPRLEGRRVLLYCSTMFPKKRQLDLVEAWPFLRDRFPDLVLVFVGGGEMLDAVRARASQVDAARIKVMGRVPEGADYHWIAACDIAVQCGGLGLAINQYLAFGKPTLVADEPGVDGEFVLDGVTGFRYEKGDPRALADAVARMLEDPPRTARIAETGRELVRTSGNIDRMVDGVFEALEFCRVRRGERGGS